MRSVTLAFLLLSSFFLSAQNKYSYSVDLKNIVDDKISIELITPSIKEQEITFSFPRVIPGSYSEKNFGSYIEDFKAFNKEGKALELKKINKNQYLIKEATTLASINYKVNDTWDTPGNEFVFQPGGSNIEA